MKKIILILIAFLLFGCINPKKDEIPNRVSEYVILKSSLIGSSQLATYTLKPCSKTWYLGETNGSGTLLIIDSVGKFQLNDTLEFSKK